MVCGSADGELVFYDVRNAQSRLYTQTLLKACGDCAKLCCVLVLTLVAQYITQADVTTYCMRS